MSKILNALKTADQMMNKTKDASFPGSSNGASASEGNPAPAIKKMVSRHTFTYAFAALAFISVLALGLATGSVVMIKNGQVVTSEISQALVKQRDRSQVMEDAVKVLSSQQTEQAERFAGLQKDIEEVGGVVSKTDLSITEIAATNKGFRSAIDQLKRDNDELRQKVRKLQQNMLTMGTTVPSAAQ